MGQVLTSSDLEGGGAPTLRLNLPFARLRNRSIKPQPKRRSWVMPSNPSTMWWLPIIILLAKWKFERKTSRRKSNNSDPCCLYSKDSRLAWRLDRPFARPGNRSIEPWPKRKSWVMSSKNPSTMWWPRSNWFFAYS
jgi:hypothetical protein